MSIAIFCVPAVGFAQADYKKLPLTGINISMRVLLQGAYQHNDGLMHNNLQLQGLLPLSQPYTAAPFDYQGGESTTPERLAFAGQDAAVDWVLLELRHKDAPFALVAQRAAIVQRDGDVVEPADGAVVLNFPDIAAGDYRVGIRHRNHLGVLTASASSLSADLTVVDFSNPQTAVVGEHARFVSGGFSLLWAGDINQDQRIVANGAGNDRNILLADILQEEGNPGFNLSYVQSGYQVGDLNLDGKAIYSGPANDSSFLLSNILLHSDNTSFANNFIINNMLSF